jgi:para-aminobenzoate synthetase component 2
MIFMLDNYDSFTYNLVQYLGELGAELKIARNDEIAVDEIMGMSPDGIVLSPGPGRPEKAGMMNDLVKGVAGRVPVLGVCLGHQAIAQVYGGSIGYAPSIMHGKTSDIDHDDSLLFRGIQSPFVATRYHSLVVIPETLPDEFKVTAWTDENVIMAIQHRQHALYGVQFHPESILTTCGKTILRNFLESLT